MRTRSWVVRCGAFLVLVLTAGLATRPAAAGKILVTVLHGSPPVAASSVAVTIIGRPISAMTNISGQAMITIMAGTYQVRARLPGFCSATATVIVTEGATTNVTLSLGPAPCPGGSEVGDAGSGGVDAGGGVGGNDKIVTTGSDPTVVLVDIRTGNVGDPSPCQNDRLVEGTGGTSDIGTNALALTDPSVSCHGAAWIFTSERAPWFDNNVASFPWTNSGGDIVNATLAANRLRVPLTVWIADPLINVANYTALMMTDLPKANSFLREQRTGLILTNSETANTLPDIIDVRGQSAVIGNGCHRLASILATPAVYRPAHLNVYVVESIDPSAAGWTCADYAVPNVIFLDDEEDYVTLVHEVGHALSLTRPFWGHTQHIPGMYPENVMEWGASKAGHLSLGQITRMHADAQSWLNQVNGIGTVRSRQSATTPFVTACSCPGASATDDCPAIAKDVLQPGSAGGGNAFPACHVKTDVSCVSLSPNSPTTITATSWTDGTASTKGFGEQLARSANPAVADVVGIMTTDNVVKANVRAGPTTGATRVFLSVGGSLATVTVKVNQSCP